MTLATHCIPYDEDCLVCNPEPSPATGDSELDAALNIPFTFDRSRSISAPAPLLPEPSIIEKYVGETWAQARDRVAAEKEELASRSGTTELTERFKEAIEIGLTAAYNTRSSGYLGGNTEDRCRTGITAAIRAVEDLFREQSEKIAEDQRRLRESDQLVAAQLRDMGAMEDVLAERDKEIEELRETLRQEFE